MNKASVCKDNVRVMDSLSYEMYIGTALTAVHGAMYGIRCVPSAIARETWGSWFKRHQNQASFLDRHRPTIRHMVYNEANQQLTVFGYYGIDELVTLPIAATAVTVEEFLKFYKIPWTATASIDMKCLLRDQLTCKWTFKKTTHSEGGIAVEMKTKWGYENNVVTIEFDHTVDFNGKKEKNTWQSTDFFDDQRQATLEALRLQREGGSRAVLSLAALK